jgi:hypothetical protein
MQPLYFDHAQLHALRIEGRKWVNDITLAQAWAILRAAYQELDEHTELLFMAQLPNGEQPALCITRRIFDTLLATPDALEQRLTRRAREKSLDEPGCGDTPLPLPTGRIHRLRAVVRP